MLERATKPSDVLNVEREKMFEYCDDDDDDDLKVFREIMVLVLCYIYSLIASERHSHILKSIFSLDVLG